MKKNKKIPKYNFGGLNDKDKTNVRNFLGNSFRATGDVGLSMLGMDNVIKDSDYKGNSAKGFMGYSDVMGGIGKSLLPAAANMILPGSGTAIRAGQQVAGNFNPEDNSLNQYDSNGNLTYQEQRNTKQLGNMLGSAGMSLGSSMGVFAMGGMNNIPNAEIELTEGTNSAGKIRKHDLPSHENATSKNQKYLPPATRILSTRLKNPLTGKPFSDETVNTKKAEKTLNDPNASPIAKKRANLDVLAANILFDRSYAVQEALKQAKVEAYAKKMGVTLPQAQKAPEEGMQYPNGGIQKYGDGGPTTPTLDNNSLIAPSVGQDPRFYNYQGNQVMVPGLRALSKDKGVSPEIGLNNYNSLLNTRTQVRDSNINVNKQLPKFEYLNDPTKGSYDEQFNAYKKVYLPGFKYGGKMLPQFWDGGKFGKKDSTYQYGRVNFLSNGQLNNTNPLAKQQLNYLNNLPSSFAPGVLGQNDSSNTPDSPYDAGKLDITMSDSSQDEDVVVPGSPIAEKDFGNIIQGYDPNTYGKVNLDDSKFSTGYLNKTNNPGAKPNWMGMAEKGLNFAAQNAGNIYDLTRKKDPLQKYDRATAKFLDPSSAIRDALAQTRRAEYNVRGASGGNAGTYLSNRVALNAQNTENLARIHQNYQNANAQISNQNSQFNTEIAYREAEAQAKDRAMRQNVDSQAIHSMASNFGKMSKSSKQDNMEQKELDMFMYRYKNEPGFKEHVDKFRTA